MSILDEEQPRPPVKKPGRVKENILINVEPNKKVANNRKDTLKVTVNLEAANAFARPGVDLVVVLDVSESMRGKKLEDLQSAMKFVIKKLGTNDRLCIIKFAKAAQMLCHLRLVKDSQAEDMFNDIIDNQLGLAWYTNIEDGLRAGLEVIQNRKHKENRFASIFLMSDGQENVGKALDVSKIGEPFDFGAFGFGSDHDEKLMAAIAKTMQGGYEFVDDGLTKISLPFAAKLGGILSVVARELTLKFRPARDGITIKQIKSGSYPQSPPGNDRAITVTYGDLYSREERTAHVLLELNEAESSPETVLYVSFEYKDAVSGKAVPRYTEAVKIKRNSDTPADLAAVLPDTTTNRKVRSLLTRDLYVDKIKEASTMAMAKGNEQLQEARAKLWEAQNVLDDVDAPYQDDPTLDMLRAELAQILKRLEDLEANKGSDDEERCVKNLVAYMLSSLMSHGSQRFASRGETDTVQLYATPRMIQYMKQAEQFEAKPDMPVTSADDDAREELIANPIAAMAGPMVFYLRVAIQALQTLEEMITGNDA
ncbi:unnamed protein product [Urochloa decumbens]|uniref:VWFA domain-containing protein n=1 Tax=Urochloa decumbens TaxID=240449 RepID=A0ABC9B7K3_9POAL